MRLDTRGREYAKWDLASAPAETSLEVTFDGATWHPLTRDGDTVSALVAGPDATDNPADAVVLPAGRSHVLIRSTANPEVLVREAGIIDVVEFAPTT